MAKTIDLTGKKKAKQLIKQLDNISQKLESIEETVGKVEFEVDGMRGAAQHAIISAGNLLKSSRLSLDEATFALDRFSKM